jgi:hypothetical protein
MPSAVCHHPRTTSSSSAVQKHSKTLPFVVWWKLPCTVMIAYNLIFGSSPLPRGWGRSWRSHPVILSWSFWWPSLSWSCLGASNCQSIHQRIQKDTYTLKIERIFKVEYQETGQGTNMHFALAQPGFLLPTSYLDRLHCAPHLPHTLHWPMGWWYHYADTSYIADSLCPFPQF